MTGSHITSKRDAPLDAGGLGRMLEDILPSLYSFALGLCGDRMVAQDLVQAACERGLGKLDQLREPAGLQSWLYRLLYTRWQDLLRQRQRRRRHLYDFSHYLEQRGGKARTGETGRVISRLDLHRSLQRLTPEYRGPLLLVSMQGYSYQEAADILDLPVGTVASRVARARKQLVERLSRTGCGSHRKQTAGVEGG